MDRYAFPALAPYLTRYGRTYIRDQSLYFDWSNAGFAFRFTGSRLLAEVTVTAPAHPQPWIEVTVDGGPARALPLPAGTFQLPLYSGPAGEEHVVTLRRRSEIGVGTTALVSLQTDGALCPPPAPRPRCIELIGDSLVCGHGSLAAAADAPFDTAYEGGTATFGVLAADRLGAECTVVGRSGLGLVANYDGKRRYTMSNTYLPTAFWDGVNDLWDFAAHPAAACVVSLGTNDWVAKVPPEEIAAAADAFLRTVRRTHPGVPIVWCYGWIEQSLCEPLRRMIAQSGDPLASFLSFDVVTDPAQLGCGHPKQAVHIRSAARLYEHLQRLLRSADVYKKGGCV
ncbi:MAG: hypothetical protein IKI50_06440 [Clostridia bacterium]|nr:hypothetical protein [Clostridia bacterium]